MLPLATPDRSASARTVSRSRPRSTSSSSAASRTTAGSRRAGRGTRPPPGSGRAGSPIVEQTLHHRESRSEPVDAEAGASGAGAGPSLDGVELDAARDLFAAASRAAQDQLLDVLNAQRAGHPDEVRAAVVDLVDAQRATVE